MLKLETFQATGSFKERGAANKLALLTPAERARGVIAMSAGNHAQAVARHAALAGIAATIVMPRFTPLTKVARTAAFGARVELHGETFAEAAAYAAEAAAKNDLVMVHPYDDPAIMAGQGTLALELLEERPDLDTLVIPVGGGGLISGCAVAASGHRPNVAIVGAEVEAYAGLADRLAGRPLSCGGATIAEGIAVAGVGALPWSVIHERVADVRVVSERAIEEAIAFLAERAKIVVEGAGAAGIAALLAAPERFRGKKIGVPVSGANIDTRIFANVLLRNLLRDGRLLRLALEIPDRPGVLADIASCIAAHDGNVIEVSHQRLFASPSVQAAHLEVMVEARDSTHAEEIRTALAARYKLERI